MSAPMDVSQKSCSLSSVEKINVGAERNYILVEMDPKTNDGTLEVAAESSYKDMSTSVPSVIKTPGVFSIIELPTELRLKILGYLLVSKEENIAIDSTHKGACIMSEVSKLEIPSIAILQTCKRINEEGTPILYGQNTFTICLSLEPRSHTHSRAFFLRPMRWSTIAYINTMYFTSNTPGLSHTNFLANRDMHGRPHAVFSCTAAHLLSRFTASDFKYSPQGPDEYAVLSMSNYVSTQVMRAELTAFQRELEMTMRPSEDYAAGLASDPAS